MKRAIMISFAAMMAIGAELASSSDANAIVCARGVYHAGCAGPRGAVVAPRHVYRAPYYHRGVRVYRRY